MKRLLCIVLILLLLPGMALGEGVALSFTAQDSKLCPQGAAEALNTLLDGMTLTVDDTGAQRPATRELGSSERQLNRPLQRPARIRSARKSHLSPR